MKLSIFLLIVTSFEKKIGNSMICPRLLRPRTLRSRTMRPRTFHPVFFMPPSDISLKESGCSQHPFPDSDAPFDSSPIENGVFSNFWFLIFLFDGDHHKHLGN